MRTLLLLIALALTASAEEKLDFRPGVKTGSTITRTTATTGDGTMTLDSGGAKKDIGCSMGTEETVAEEVLEARSGRATKMKRFYHVKRSSFEVPSADKSETTDSSLTGHLLTVTFRDGKTTTTCDDQNFDPKDLAREGIDDEWAMPLASEKPVAPGDAWEPDAKLVQAWLDARRRKCEDAKLTCLFTGYAEVSGRKCAKVEVELTAKGTATDRTVEQKISWTLKGTAWWGVAEGRVVQFDLAGDLVAEWDNTPAGKPAEHWVSTMKLTLKGSSTPGEAKFELEKKK